MKQVQLYHSSLSHMLTQVGTFPQARGVVSFLVVRGAQLDKQVSDDCLQINVENDPPYGDKHNDLFIMFWTDEAGVPRLECVPCTSHPSKRYTKHPSKAAGAAWLPTYTAFNYMRGSHRKRAAYNMVDWLNYVVRDTDQNGEISAADSLDTGYFGVNIHPGTESAGCIVISGGWHDENWKKVVAWQDGKQKLFQTMILDALDIARWVGGSAQYKLENWCPTIAFGTRNPWVGKLQEVLDRPGMYVKVDNHWGPATQNVYDEVLLGMNFPCLPHLTEEVWSALQNKEKP